MITNVLNLPEPFVRAVAAAMGSYSKGRSRYSITELIKPARLGALERSAGEMDVDVSECLYMLDGVLSHDLLHRAGVEDGSATVLEERLFMDLDGVCISGAMDCAILMPTGKISDYKKTKVWGVVTGSKIAEWTAQLNGYVMLAEANGRAAVTELEVAAWFSDWSVGQARRERAGGRYPQRQAQIVPIELWSERRTREYFTERLVAHMAADATRANEPGAPHRQPGRSHGRPRRKRWLSSLIELSRSTVTRISWGR